MKKVLAIVAMLAVAFVLAGGATAATSVSSNWSGYAVSGATYKTVTGTWVQPAASCSAASSATASAFWVGLGGDSESSNALEQAGTEADCSGGTASYSAWYELVPAASVKVPLTISAGDTVTASVTVDGTRVTVQIRDVTTGASFEKTLTTADADTSSAEWIAEAPSVVTQMGARTLSLTDFGTVRFTHALATTVSGVTGSISHAGWTVQQIRLESASGAPGQFGPNAAVVEAVPTTLRSGGSAFAVTWKRAATAAGPPGF